jgi:hypothetical protein
MNACGTVACAAVFLAYSETCHTRTAYTPSTPWIGDAETCRTSTAYTPSAPWIGDAETCLTRTGYTPSAPWIGDGRIRTPKLGRPQQFGPMLYQLSYTDSLIQYTIV